MGALARDPRLQDFTLLPCPKCGADAGWRRPMGNRIYGKGPPFYGVNHFKVACSASSQECGALVSGTSETTPTQAAMQWNKRSTYKGDN